MILNFSRLTAKDQKSGMQFLHVWTFKKWEENVFKFDKIQKQTFLKLKPILKKIDLAATYNNKKIV